MAPPDTLERCTVSVEQAAAALGISRRTAFRHVASGAVRTIKLGRRRLVPASEIERLMTAQADRSGAGTAYPPATPQTASTADAARAQPSETRPALSRLIAAVNDIAEPPPHILG